MNSPDFAVLIITQLCYFFTLLDHQKSHFRATLPPSRKTCIIYPPPSNTILCVEKPTRESETIRSGCSNISVLNGGSFFFISFLSFLLVLTLAGKPLRHSFFDLVLLSFSATRCCLWLSPCQFVCWWGR